MASQYIDVNNQTILWKVIQRSPQFINNTIQINREQWFGSIIKLFYEQITAHSFSIEELKIWNQKTIAYMLSDLKKIEQFQTNPSRTSERESVVGMNDMTPTRVLRPGALSTYTEQFNERQQEYEKMIKPPAQPIPNFGEKVDDDVITNMDELLEQQKKQREYDIAQVIPPPPQKKLDENPQQPVVKTTNDVLTIQNLLLQIESMKKDIQILMYERNSATSQPTQQSIQENFCYQ